MSKKILIIVAAVVVPFLAMLVLFYFLYPQLNEEKYEQILSESTEDQTEEPVRDEFEYNEVAIDEPSAENYTFEDYESQPNNLELLLAEQKSLQSTIDSLKNEKEALVSELDELNSSVDSLRAV